jgi:hypothetical protein
LHGSGSGLAAPPLRFASWAVFRNDARPRLPFTRALHAFHHGGAGLGPAHRLTLRAFFRRSVGPVMPLVFAA